MRCSAASGHQMAVKSPNSLQMNSKHLNLRGKKNRKFLPEVTKNHVDICYSYLTWEDEDLVSGSGRGRGFRSWTRTCYGPTEGSNMRRNTSQVNTITPTRTNRKTNRDDQTADTFHGDGTDPTIRVQRWTVWISFLPNNPSPFLPTTQLFHALLVPEASSSSSLSQAWRVDVTPAIHQPQQASLSTWHLLPRGPIRTQEHCDRMSFCRAWANQQPALITLAAH